MQARGLSRESVDKIRDVLSSVLGSAVKYGFLVTNPAAVAATAAPQTRDAATQTVCSSRAVFCAGGADSKSPTPRWFMWRFIPGCGSAS